MKKVHLTESQEKQFEHMLMVSILKTLKSEGLLTDVQLMKAIAKIESENSCPPDKNAV